MRAFIAAGVVFFSASLCLSAAPALADVQERLKVVLDDVAALTPLRTVVIAHDGETIAERGYGGHSVTAPANIKSASKTIVSAMVGIAIDKGLLEGVDQPVAGLLASYLPDAPDPRLRDITIGHLLSMQAGLERTSGQNYGRWVASRDWVRFVLAQPFADEPGGSMLYSTGSTHLLSAILTRVGGKSTLALAREWFADIDDFSIASWDRDPQGIYFGGNQMAMSPRSLLAFGEMYRKGGVAENGERVVSARWIEESWRVRTHSRFTQDGYGYGWFQRNIAGEDVSYAWGYGGQMLYIVPSVGLTVVMTSDESAPSGRTGHREDLHGVLGRIIEAVKTGDTTSN
ncbi:serine hydrolase domain-containing protein [Aquamicrobium terrae]|uniref:CubicO group peptidase (Beta-lactamase class C family) n=1 Tax=Aquamicrobium terrae TaxID=1324945 RepID=A0ABV2MXR5_9HYPH